MSHADMSAARRGFTIVELLIVIVVIGILAAVVGVTAGVARAKAVDAHIVNDMKVMQRHLEAFYADKGYYPPNDNIQLGSGYTWMRANFDTTDWSFLVHPNAASGVSSNFSSISYPGSGGYSYRAYIAYPSTCNTVSMEGQCQAYRLAWFSEVDRTVKVIYVAR